MYSNKGDLVKLENHYVQEEDFTISPNAFDVHKISHQYLQKNGNSRKAVLTQLSHDLQQYDPLLVGHFMELDARMVGADFYRLNLENPLEKYPAFCTMKASATLVQNPQKKYLKLFDLYKLLFKKNLQNQHNALVDAQATADCFFEMVKRGYLNDNIIQQQVTYFKEPILKPETGCGVFALALFLITITVYFL